MNDYTHLDRHDNEYDAAELAEIIISNNKAIYDQACDSAYLLSGVKDDAAYLVAFAREASDLLVLYGNTIRSGWDYAYISETDVIEGFRRFIEYWNESIGCNAA